MDDRSDNHELDSSIRPKVIGDFKIIKELGKGAQGTVYEAEQISLNRRVALKVLPPYLTFSDNDVLRFKREAAAGGRQSHAGIVAIYAVGEYEGIHYIAQELVGDGVTLKDNLDQIRGKGEQPPGYFRIVAKLIADVADALQHAHESGVIHRDIKPSNILMTEKRYPKVSDFGLAKVEDALALSRTGDFAGTPYYMSPEQALSRRIGIDHRTDIFSLGVTLYEMLTLQRPFEGKTSQEVFKQIVMLEPHNPMKRNPRVPRDLSVICLKAMEKDPGRRYQTMVEFAKDLKRFLEGDVILAKPAGLGTRVLKRVKRNPVISASVGVAILSIVVFAVVVPWIIAVKEQENAASLKLEKDKAIAAQAIAEQQTRLAKEQRNIAEMEKERALAAEKDAEYQRKLAEDRARVIQKNYSQMMRLADLKRLSDLNYEAEELWPAYPENISRLEEWLVRAEDVLTRFDEHKETLASFRLEAYPYGSEDAEMDRKTHPRSEELIFLKQSRKEIEASIASLEQGGESESGAGGETGKPVGSTADLESMKKRLADLDSQIDELEKMVSERRTWKFELTETQWQHDMVAGLVSGLEDFFEPETGLFQNVRKRLAFASIVEKRSIHDQQEAWAGAIAGIADEQICPQYDGLAIEPIIGFVPIGRDPVSGLWEFAHLETGEIPARGLDGKLNLTEETGLVFVLIPGGSFDMGAVKPSAELPIGSPNVDPDAGPDESPVHTVTLKPFFLSKYEMTQGQWLRFVGENPSSYPPSSRKFGDKQHNLLHPVETVSWKDCSKALTRMKLRLPSEAEWEYAARAGTTTIWSTGDEEQSLKGFANLVDTYCQNHGGPPGWPYVEWLDDGYVAHAPVGTLLPNAFGLHDVHGNNWEWCQDFLTPNYKSAPISHTAKTRGSQRRVLRGGGWNGDAFQCRSAYRNGYAEDYRYNALGVRPAFSYP